MIEVVEKVAQNGVCEKGRALWCLAQANGEKGGAGHQVRLPYTHGVISKNSADEVIEYMEASSMLEIKCYIGLQVMLVPCLRQSEAGMSRMSITLSTERHTPVPLYRTYFFLPCASVALNSRMKTLMTPSGTSSTPSSKPGLMPTATNLPSEEKSIV